MQISQIEQVIAIAAEGSINKAAQKLYLSQPNLSASIHRLESELGQSIFERTGRGVQLTAFGSVFLAYAQPAYRQYKILNQFCTMQQMPQRQHLSVASQHLRFASQLFSKLCQQYEEVPYSFSFLEGSMQEVADMVASSEADIGFLIVPQETRRMQMASFRMLNLNYRCLSSEEVAILVRRDHPLCQNDVDTVTVEELREYPLAIYQDTNYDFLSTWNDIGITEPWRKVTLADRASLYELLEATNAYTLGTHSISAYQNTQYYSSIRVLRLADSKSRLEIGCVTHANHSLTPLAEEYLNCVLKALEPVSLT